ncbi:MAG: amidohydrolase family protein [Anaerolineaceae bacterium]|nr:amidohydrolase family protein [Anaerolineaceae bacterium]MDE0327792.1 amidohydrolase family protein [Anaerolineaceae bacterium]
MKKMVLSNARVLDTRGGRLLDSQHILIEDGRITSVSEASQAGEAQRIDVGGRVVMPGLCDAHVHVTAATAAMATQRHWSPAYVTALAAQELEATLMRGFTTVRDGAGADWGLAQAVEEGLLVGPRLFFCGHALSPTGGHGDMRSSGDDGRGYSWLTPDLGWICDGVSELRRACREEIRRGAHHIKLMVSGGVASPTDRIDSLQFSEEELRAAVEEADNANLYVMVHAYTARAVNRSLRCGVRSVEHGNLLDESSIELFLEHDAFLVPTLSTYQALADEGLAAGLPEESYRKVFDVLDAGKRALEMAYRGGVKMVYGTDLLGPMRRRQLDEFAIRGEFIPAIDVLRAATCNAADLLGRSGDLGELIAGAHADLLVLEGDPLADLGVMARPEANLRLIMKGGVIYKNSLD